MLKDEFLEPLFKLLMSKKGTPLWHEAPSASQNVQTTCVLAHFWSFRCGKGVRQTKEMD